MVPVANTTADLRPDAATRVGFSIGVDGLTSDLSVMTATVMPGADLALAADADVLSETGELSSDGENWIWTAPDQPGHNELFITRNDETMLLNVFVLTPFSNGKEDSING